MTTLTRITGVTLLTWATGGKVVTLGDTRNEKDGKWKIGQFSDAPETANTKTSVFTIEFIMLHL